MKTCPTLLALAWIGACSVSGCGPPPAAPAARPPSQEPAAETPAPESAVPAPRDLPPGPAPPGIVDDQPTPVSAATGHEPIDIGGDVLPPKRVSSPSYDEINALLRSGRFRWGACILSSVVNRRGELEQIELLKPEAVSPQVEEVLIRTLSAYRFEPATRNAEPVAVRYHLLIHHCPHWPREPRPPP